MLAPVILVAKIILQDICRTGIGWDDEVDKQDFLSVEGMVGWIASALPGSN